MRKSWRGWVDHAAKATSGVFSGVFGDLISAVQLQSVETSFALGVLRRFMPHLQSHSELQELRREMEAEQRRMVAREAQLCREKYQAQLEEEERNYQQQASGRRE